MPKEIPSVETLRKLLKYDPSTGKLYWRERTPDMFSGGKHSAEHICRNWNSKYAGEEAFTANIRGYKQGTLLGLHFLAHRVAWAIHNGEWPRGEIDHVNGDRSNNKIANLRNVSRIENSKNLKKRCDNTSGVMGVFWEANLSKWRVRVGAKHVGVFSCFDEAVAARKVAAEAAGYHKNHDRDT